MPSSPWGQTAGCSGSVQSRPMLHHLSGLHLERRGAELTARAIIEGCLAIAAPAAFGASDQRSGRLWPWGYGLTDAAGSCAGDARTQPSRAGNGLERSEAGGRETAPRWVAEHGLPRRRRLGRGRLPVTDRVSGWSA
jgi:hypothetical protein